MFIRLSCPEPGANRRSCSASTVHGNRGARGALPGEPRRPLAARHAPGCSRSADRRARGASASASALASPAGKSRPRPRRHDLGQRPGVARKPPGRRAPCASSTGSPKPSYREGKTKPRHPRRAPGAPASVTRPVKATRARCLERHAASFRGQVSAGSVPTNSRRRSRFRMVPAGRTPAARIGVSRAFVLLHECPYEPTQVRLREP